MKNQQVTGLCPKVCRQQLAQVFFYRLWVGRSRPPKAFGNTAYVGIHNHPGNTKGITKNYIGCFPSDTWQGSELRHGMRNLATVVF
jgi:hypothetical protein